MNDITLFAETTFRNQRVKFGIKTDDRRRHMYLIGKSGTGKSNTLENMAISDILAGRGVAFVDPHGESAERILDFIPENRLDDVIYLDPADIDWPLAFNPLENVDTEHRHLIASGMMGVFKKIWPDVWSARMEYILNNTLLALLEYPSATLLGIMRMLAEKEYRQKITENLEDPVVKAFWLNEFAKYTQRLETEAVAAIQNKVGQFVANPLIRNIVGQVHSSFDMRKIMDEGKILIVNLSKGKIGEDNSALLGAMIISKIQLAAMSRSGIPTAQLRDFYLYVDEFQNFSTESFANILSEARKYKLNLILAHQYINQLVHDQNSKVRDAVFGNVGTIVCFRVGAEDAEFLEKEFLPYFNATDLVNLAKYNIYVKLLIDGVASRPFSAQTLPPPKPPVDSCKDAIIENTRRIYATQRKLVEEKIASEWLQSKKTIEDLIQRKDEQSLERLLIPQPEIKPRQEYQPPRQEYAPQRPEGIIQPRPAPKPQTGPIQTEPTKTEQPKPEQPKPETFEPKKERKPVDIDELKKAIGESLKDIGEE